MTYSTPGTYVASFKVTDNGGPRAHRPRGPSRCPTSRSRPRRPLERFWPEPAPAIRRRSPAPADSPAPLHSASAACPRVPPLRSVRHPSSAPVRHDSDGVDGRDDARRHLSADDHAERAGRSPTPRHVTLVVRWRLLDSATPASRTVTTAPATRPMIVAVTGVRISERREPLGAGLPKFVTATFAPASIAPVGHSTLTVDHQEADARRDVHADDHRHERRSCRTPTNVTLVVQ